MTRAVPILVTFLGLSACSLVSTQPEVIVDDPVITLPAIPGRPGAAYFTLRTNVDPTRLVSVTSPRIGRIELHETVTVSGFSRMIPLRNAAFNSDRPMRFEAGGRHAMLFDLDPALRPGDRVSLTFSFDPAPPVTVEAEVRAAGDVAHGGH
jgi:copper(I)-binding protein